MERQVWQVVKIALSFALIASSLAAKGASKPNFIVIVVDDAALMDFGATGGEASTPNIDMLAQRGALFTNYHSSPLCSPSRAMLLTGLDNHRTGHATIEEVLPPEQAGKPGYTLRLEPGVLTVAKRLKAGDYRTYMTGKWHLGRNDGDLPNAHGFDRSFALDASGADNWEQKSYMPYYDHAPWFEDGKPATLPAGFYSSQFIVEKMIDYLKSGEANRPFFGYLAFQAVHIPVQVPREFSDKYKGRFDQGWEALRQARWARAQAMGVVPTNAPYAPLPPMLRHWNKLSAEEHRIFARSMEVYSGMIEAMDHHIGRLIAHLKSTGQFENTIFVVTSDNGPEPSDPVHATGMNIWMALNGYHWDIARLGERGSMGFIGPEWAAAISSPGSLFKFYTTGGGLRVPLIVSGPGILSMRHASSAFVTDVTPTILDFAGVDASAVSGAKAMNGVSLRPVLDRRAERTHADDKSIGVEVAGNAALFKGDYKIVRNGGALSDPQWRLYNITDDPAETRDLSGAEPTRFAAMIADYRTYMARNGVLDMPPGYNVQRQVEANAIKRQIAAYWWVIIFIGFSLLGIGVLVRRAFRMRHTSQKVP
jgi:arylsulfatase A-like enzyme